MRHFALFSEDCRNSRLGGPGEMTSKTIGHDVVSIAVGFRLPGVASRSATERIGKSVT